MPPFPQPAARAVPIRLLALAWLFGTAAPQAVGREPLDSALAVRSLDHDAAEAGQPVDLTAVVTFSDPPNTVFVQDETAGTFFQLGGADPPRPGDEVRVRGESFPGLYLPGITETTFEIVGHPGLPEAQPASYDDLMSGRFHYQRVAIEGIVRTLVPEGESASLVRIALGSRIVEVRVERPATDDAPSVDDRLRVTGLAAGHINDRRQLVAPYLRCRDWSRFRVLEAGAPTESVPLLSSEQLLNFDVDGHGGHRVRLRGAALASFPPDRLFLRDDEAAVGVRLLDEASDIAPGDAVEVIGFPAMERFSGSLVDAEVVSHEPGEGAPRPVSATLGELMQGDLDGNLVAATAALAESYRTADGGILVLQDEGATVRARLPVAPDGLAADSRVRVAGICQVDSTSGSSYRSTPESVSLRVRSRDDVEVLRAPGWWTYRRLAAVLVLLLVAVLLAGLWIALLRRQVSRQTMALTRRIEHEATLEERQRIAREFHDSLEQELAGLSLRLDAASAGGGNGKVGSLVDDSRRLVSRIQAETRNLVSDLRDTSGERSDLAAVLAEIAGRQPDDVPPEISFFPPENPMPPLPSRTVHHLGMIAREAVTNALKHADASAIELHLEVEDETLRMRIADDGRGFDPETRSPDGGHFGCVGICERCDRLGATVAWTRNETGGVTVEIDLPLESLRT